MEVYDRLSVEDAASFAKMKEALLKNFGMTERGYRTKFRVDMPEKSETFIQYGSRLRSYLNKWLCMAKVEKSYEPFPTLWLAISSSNHAVENCTFI